MGGPTRDKQRTQAQPARKARPGKQAATDRPLNPQCIAMRCHAEKRCIGIEGGCMTVDSVMAEARVMPLPGASQEALPEAAQVDWSNVLSLVDRLTDALDPLLDSPRPPSWAVSLRFMLEAVSPEAAAHAVNPVPADPLSMPLPCDIDCGGVRFAKGTRLRTLVEAATRWKAKGTARPKPTAEQIRRFNDSIGTARPRTGKRV